MASFSACVVPVMWKGVQSTPRTEGKDASSEGKEGLSSPPPDRHNIFFSSSFGFRAVYDLSVSQNHLAGSSKAKKNGQKKKSGLQMH